MSYNSKILELIPKVAFTSLQQYLQTRGWNKLKIKTDNFIIWSSPDDRAFFDIILPLNKNFADYNESIGKAISKISLYESRDELQIINDLSIPPSDTLKYRVINNETTYGLIPLSAGFELLESAKKSLISAASDYILPSLFHRRMAYKPVMDFIEACYLGQTERASFSATIVCPFIKISDESISQLSLFSTEKELHESFTRKITTKVMSSLFRVKNLIEENRTEELLDPDSKENVISSNFLQSLVEINEFTQNSKIEISAAWASTVFPPQNVVSRVEITNEYIEPIKSIIDRLTPSTIEEEGEYVGRISFLKADPDIKNRTEAEIHFIFIGEDEKALSANVNLKGDDLKEAFKAFEEGKNVKIKGRLKISHNRRNIENPIFSVV